MIRFVGLRDNNKVHIGLGLDAENIKRLTGGEPIFIELGDMRLPDIELSITYGETLKDIQVEWAHAGIKFEANPPPPEP